MFDALRIFQWFFLNRLDQQWNTLQTTSSPLNLPMTIFVDPPWVSSRLSRMSRSSYFWSINRNTLNFDEGGDFDTDQDQWFKEWIQINSDGRPKKAGGNFSATGGSPGSKWRVRCWWWWTDFWSRPFLPDRGQAWCRSPSIWASRYSFKSFYRFSSLPHWFWLPSCCGVRLPS